MATKMKAKCHSTSFVVTFAQFLQPTAISCSCLQVAKGILEFFIVFLFVYIFWVCACLLCFCSCCCFLCFVGVFFGGVAFYDPILS